MSAASKTFSYWAAAMASDGFVIECSRRLQGEHIAQHDLAERSGSIAEQKVTHRHDAEQRKNKNREERTAASELDRQILFCDEQCVSDGAIHRRLPARGIHRRNQPRQSMLGRRFEGGIDVSGGEWQKLALARAYLRDAQLLILDEPTASLDARSEHEVFERFAELTEGKMALLISHRFSTVRMADRILVLENGIITEEGDHEELIAQRGRYSEMFELQAASYR